MIFGISHAQDLPVMPTVPPVINDSLQGAAEGINDLPSDPSVIGGVDVLPAVDARGLFGYVKYLFSPSITRELLGEFSPFGDTTFRILLLMAVATGIYIALNIIVLLIRLAIFVFNLVLKIIEIIIAIFDALTPL